MAEQGKITVNNLRILHVDAAPTGGGGIAAAIGSLAMNSADGSLWRKTGAGDTAWTEVTASTGPLTRVVDATTVATVASVDITGLSATATYHIYFWNTAPATDAVDLWMRVSTDNGSSFFSGATDYAYALNRTTSSNSPLGSNTDTKIILMTSVDNGAAPAKWAAGIITFTANAGTVEEKPISIRTTWLDSAGSNQVHAVGAGRFTDAQDFDAVRFLFSSGNISQMTYAVYREDVS